MSCCHTKYINHLNAKVCIKILKQTQTITRYYILTKKILHQKLIMIFLVT